MGGQTRESARAATAIRAARRRGRARRLRRGWLQAAIGTETDGSIVCPSGANGIVGLKPTVGLVPRTHRADQRERRTRRGPMALTVADAALLLDGDRGI